MSTANVDGCMVIEIDRHRFIEVFHLLTILSNSLLASKLTSVHLTNAEDFTFPSFKERVLSADRNLVQTVIWVGNRLHVLWQYV